MNPIIIYIILIYTIYYTIYYAYIGIKDISSYTGNLKIIEVVRNTATFM